MMLVGGKQLFVKPGFLRLTTVKANCSNNGCMTENNFAKRKQGRNNSAG